MPKFKALAAFASILAINLSFSSIAGELTTTGTPASIAVNNGLVGFLDGDSLKLGGAHNLLTSGNHVISAIDINGNNSRVFTISHDITLGSVGNSGLAGKFLTILYGGAQTITLSGTAGSGTSTIGLNNYSAVGLVDFSNQDGILALDAAGVNYTSNFKSTGGDNGAIRILQNSTLSGLFDATPGTRVASLFVFNGSSVLNTNLNLSGNVTLQQATFTINPGFSINANNISFNGETFGTIIFGNNTTLNAEVITQNFAANIVEFQGASNILKKIDILGGGSKVIFSSNNPTHRSSLTNNISADNIEIRGSKIGIDAEEIALSGQTTAADTTFDLGLNTLLFARNSATITGAPIFNTTFDGTKGGHLAGEGININMSDVGAVTINLTDNSPVPGPEGRQYTLFAELRGVLQEGEVAIPGSVDLPDNGGVTLNPPANPLVQWTYSDGILRQVMVPNVDEVVINAAPSNQPNVVVILNSAAREDLLNVVNQSGNVAQLLEALQPDQAAENASQMISGTTRGIDTRINSVQTADIGSSGVSAGDTQTHGAWVTPFFGDIRQKQRGTSPGYAAKYFGTILGFDTLLKDDSTLGFALTFIKNLVNHKDSNNGDKTVIQTAVLSLYGLKNLTDNWFVQGVASIGSSKIDGREVRFTFPNTSTASADYNSISYTTEITGGYSHFLAANTILTPLFGIEYTRLNKIEYTETGAGAQNLTINRKVFNKAELIAGAKFNHSIVLEDFTFIPEIHGFIRYNTINKGIKLAVSLSGQNGAPLALVPKTAVQTRTTYLVGAGFDIKKSTFEYGLAYDARIAEKYISHQGVLKLRLVF